MPLPLSIAMTPAFYDEGHALLRMQLACLSAQTVKQFDVWLIDPHFHKRRGVVPELASHYKLDIKHVPYSPNIRIAKVYDCAIFNAAFCYSTSPQIARYSCYRFARRNWVEKMLSAPKDSNVDFGFHALGPLLKPGDVSSTPLIYDSIWNWSSDKINWDAIPKRSGYDQDPANNLANWPPKFDEAIRTPVRVPGDVYGNHAWRRDQWFELNGTNEVITNAAHWEDLDFDTRANNAGQTIVRFPHLLYRIHHTYGNYSQRSNVPVDVPFTSPCKACLGMVTKNGGDADYGIRVSSRISSGDLVEYPEIDVWICKSCKLSGPIYGALGLDEYFKRLISRKTIKSPIIASEMIGRNLPVLAERMDKLSSVSDKFTCYNDSWSNPDYYA